MKILTKLGRNVICSRINKIKALPQADLCRNFTREQKKYVYITDRGKIIYMTVMFISHIKHKQIQQLWDQ
jgi:hypothetical protein